MASEYNGSTSWKSVFSIGTILYLPFMLVNEKPGFDTKLSPHFTYVIGSDHTRYDKN